MVAEIICVGTELLLGQILNTNSQYLAQKLAELGIDLYFQTTVGDNMERLKMAIDIATKRSDVLIFTGGLGPTSDDITKEAVADYFGLTLVLDEDILRRIESFFERRQVKMPQINKKQAYVPEGAKVLHNKNGTAPGLIIEKDGKIAILLPGPPFEMQPMFEEEVLPYLEKFSKQKIYSRVLKFIGIGESSIEEALKDLILSQTDPTMALYAKPFEVELRITTKKESEELAKSLLQSMEYRIRERLGEYIYGVDRQLLEEVVIGLLTEKKLKVSVAESCTGGLICNKLTNVPGASEVFDRGFIVYSNEAKMKLLGVPEQVLKEHGAVSSQTARFMAQGALSNSLSDIALSVTGIAGPGGGSETKPVGLVYIGIATKDNVESFEFRFSGDRLRIKEMTSKAALNILRKKIIDY
ncbi:nicotinamide-nucleotide amidase [Caldicellulosiruptor bescii]|uniref:Putative competence-damage inducible protein n=2 Tax=Caldicellulosiruptor bescii TaxID=31899 RepID=CINA_CALBD|nr:competence/damage-inducible protein A [Caldicellulosiruptor bescii]B9MQY2.1 RecName: Full=Putative competence-damage inducible protein [Caldicellulosiruptor bescii DSM 6725]ACM60086.1 competence/damage-inducible protein CinA [Caldicellulosiruptor bescii DSM 6725]PBC87501.1 nicotinamide-nucleotide amidase [Caldicellulosiruptor bescii]PBC90434.1 nicotinamide-nucleotide amidase [Caldicellulosiruptor bescii]PBD04134.1 nicotinamide-nucleotide amidase [Caldicellulosiruptor bescii]PBD06231.1 nico